ncbi:gastrula zinc finger protein XlCGF71.1-like [Eleutherodactylus coqui]|uniref:gastrula zinc finger protein XlCGF71.1-like n=1 Tax=Eleutherodactylus coqui TaxID=57060 RepID=UPI003462274F
MAVISKCGDLTDFNSHTILVYLDATGSDPVGQESCRNISNGHLSLSSDYEPETISIQVLPEETFTAPDRIHTDDPKFQCSECPKSFVHKLSLVKHQRIHTVERPFSCSECGKCFSQKSDFVKHPRIHTGKKPFSCSESGKCFTQKPHLVRHQMIHKH